MSLAITRRNGSCGQAEKAVSKYFIGTYLAGVLAIGELFNSIYFAPRCEDSFACYYLLPPCRGGSGNGAREPFQPRGWRAIIANNKRESHLIIMIVRLLSVAPSNNFVSR